MLGRRLWLDDQVLADYSEWQAQVQWTVHGARHTCNQGNLLLKISLTGRYLQILPTTTETTPWNTYEITRKVSCFTFMSQMDLSRTLSKEVHLFVPFPSPPKKKTQTHTPHQAPRKSWSRRRENFLILKTLWSRGNVLWFVNEKNQESPPSL